MSYSKIIINTDGGARGNPGPAAIGVTAKTDNGEILFEISESIGDTTNNVAEYTAVLHALKHLHEHEINTVQITFILDSELIVRQITGLYRIKEPRLQTLVTEVQNIIRQLKQNGRLQKINFLNVPRSQNKRADQLVNQALDTNR